jgi:DNA polymerase-3 subunit gamma/tau
VLSRCQRFDLRRVGVAELAAHFTRIAEREQVAIAAGAIEHIARAADGSVRDGLSLLDQAIARGAEDNSEISTAMVADMLGLADRSYVFDLMEAVVAGDAAKALAIADGAYERGADLGVLLGDLLGLAHLLTRMKSVPALSAATSLPEAERTRGAALAGMLSIPFLGRLWQMLLKGVQEVEAAPDRRAAAEMILIRLCHVADMPPPGELLRRITEGGGAGPAGLPGPPGNGGGARAVANGNAAVMTAAAPRAITFNDVVALASARRDAMLYAHLRQSVHLVRFAPPVIEVRLEPHAPRDLAQKLAALLEAETNRRWTIALSNAPGAPTLDEAEGAAEDAARQSAIDHPLVQAILEAFPGAKIEAQAPLIEDEPELPADWAALTPPDELYEGDEE